MQNKTELSLFMPAGSQMIGERSDPGRAQRAVPAYNVAIYEREKSSGIRRANGAKKLKKLSNRHLGIISMHLEGKSGEAIAKILNVRVVTVSRILNDPLAKHIISKIFTDRQMELDALAGKAIDAVRTTFEEGTTREKLVAVDKYAKLKDTIGTDVSSAESAEDIVAKIFQGSSAETINIQVNLGAKDGG